VKIDTDHPHTIDLPIKRYSIFKEQWNTLKNHREAV